MDKRTGTILGPFIGAIITAIVFILTTFPLGEFMNSSGIRNLGIAVIMFGSFAIPGALVAGFLSRKGQTGLLVGIASGILGFFIGIMYFVVQGIPFFGLEIIGPGVIAISAVFGVIGGLIGKYSGKGRQTSESEAKSKQSESKQSA